jgi:hypothetical protein
MSVMSPMGKVPQRKPPRPPKRRRRRRFGPALTMIGVLCILAATTWWQVLSRADPAPASQAPVCGVRQTTPSALPKPNGVQLRVYNATDRSGLARSMGGELKKRGFAVLATANDPVNSVRQIQGVGEIRHGPAGLGRALLLSTMFPGMKLLPDDRSDGVVDVVLGPAFKRMATTKEAAAAAPKALQTLKAAPAGTSC